jgi:hypothetical protein
MNLFEQVKNQVSILTLITKFNLNPVKRGAMLCPFHNERTPSCSVSPIGDKFHCFGCGAGGSVIDFYRLLTGKSEGRDSDLESAKELAAMAGIAIDAEYTRPLREKYKEPTNPTPARSFTLRYDRTIPKAFWAWLDSKGIDVSIGAYMVDEGSIRFIDGGMAFVYNDGVKLRPEYKTSKSCRWISGGAGNSLWRYHEARKPCNLLIICEGESDTMKCLSALLYLKTHNVMRAGILVRVVGAPQASWSPSGAMKELLPITAENVLLAFDNDKAGIEAHTRISDLYSSNTELIKYFPWPFFPDKTDLGEISTPDLAKVLASFIDTI